MRKGLPGTRSRAQTQVAGILLRRARQRKTSRREIEHIERISKVPEELRVWGLWGPLPGGIACRAL